MEAGMQQAAITVAEVRRRFFAGFCPEALSGCWLWDGPALSGRPYGVISIGSRDRGMRLLAHRVAFLLSHGPIPARMFVCHKCDVPACVNPDHLFLGTQRDNMRDCQRKGRLKFHAFETGESHPLARLSADVVRAMRARHAHGATYKALAIEVGVSDTTARRAIRKETWKHV
jgi:hypothetical protein